METKPDAVVALLRSRGRFLVIRRAAGVPWPGYWTPPSGRVEPGEAQVDTLRREMREELGVDISPVTKVWECDTDGGEYRLHWWRADYSGELRLEQTEVAEARWVTPAEFLELEPTFAGDREFVTRVLPTL